MYPFFFFLFVLHCSGQSQQSVWATKEVIFFIRERPTTESKYFII